MVTTWLGVRGDQYFIPSLQPKQDKQIAVLDVLGLDKPGTL